LYAGGRNVAQWNGSNWSALGSGVSNPFDGVLALAASGGNLFVGGSFAGAGTNLSPNLAEAILVPSSAPPVILTTNGSYGFTAGHSSFGFDVAGSQAQTVTVLASTNLVNWWPLQTNVLGGTQFHFSDPSASSFPRRFYRAELWP
jgi:hypothetical protein